MPRLKKKVFLGFSAMCLALLAAIRFACPGVMSPVQCLDAGEPATIAVDERQYSHASKELYADTIANYHKIYSVPSYHGCFPDLPDLHDSAADKHGVSPARDRKDAEQRKSEFVFVGNNPYYDMDSRMECSVPYLVPRAASLLQAIGRAYTDSLAIKGIPLHKVIVTSVLRTEQDVERLMKKNKNASPKSCHRYGTTFDICYNRYATVSPPGENRRMVSNDTLKWVLSEVLSDFRNNGLCYVKYEEHQSCFHITAR